MKLARTTASDTPVLRPVLTLAICLVGITSAPHLDAQRFGPSQSLAEAHPHDLEQIAAGDLDGDGDVDVVLVSPLTWYENPGNCGECLTPRILDSRTVHAACIGDVDGDGDADLLAAVAPDEIVWYENLSGLGDFGTPRVLAYANAEKAALQTADLDGDGDLDLLFTSRELNLVAWYENLDGLGDFGSQQLIAPNATPHDLHAADVDGDGDLDVLVALTVTISWYANTDGQGTFGPRQTAVSSFFQTTSVTTGDLDGDGDQDIVGGTDRAFWSENTNGLGSFGPPHNLATTPIDSGRVRAADLDGDGDVDIWAALDVQNSSSNVIAWWDNTDGLGQFGSTRTILTTNASPIATVAPDLDGDGDLDVLTGYGNGEDGVVAWHENLDGSGTFGDELIITGFPSTEEPESIEAADLDGDGDPDLLACLRPDHELVWYETRGGANPCLRKHVVTSILAGPAAVRASDLDGDGDLDLVSAFRGSGMVTWHENLDGQGSFGPLHMISAALPDADLVAAADLDGDGDDDVVACSFSNGTIYWFENNVAGGGFSGPPRLVSDQSLRNKTLQPADLDGDGDQDILVSAKASDWFAWFPNTDGAGSFGPIRIIHGGVGGAWTAHAADVDGDGDLDVLGSARLSNRVVWYENLDGQGNFGSMQIIADRTTLVGSVTTADLDGDGDLDVISSSESKGKVAWYENQDGAGDFKISQVVNWEATGSSSAVAADLDQDGDLDLIYATDDYGDGVIGWSRNGPFASATYRNAAPNPSSHSAVTLPELGGTYTAEVDLAGTTAHGAAMLAAFSAPASFALGGNVVLVDITHPAGELLGYPLATGPVASFSFGIPPDPVFGGMKVFTQAIHVGGVFPYVLSNAQDLFFGY